MTTELERGQARDAAEVRVAVALEWVIRRSLDVLRARTDEELIAAGAIKGSPLSVVMANDYLGDAARQLAAALTDPAYLEDQ